MWLRCDPQRAGARWAAVHSREGSGEDEWGRRAGGRIVDGHRVSSHCPSICTQGARLLLPLLLGLLAPLALVHLAVSAFLLFRSSGRRNVTVRLYTAPRWPESNVPPQRRVSAARPSRPCRRPRPGKSASATIPQGLCLPLHLTGVVFHP